MVFSTGTYLRTVVGLDAEEFAPVAFQLGEAVEPQGTLLHRSIEFHHAAPDVGLARMAEVGLGQDEDAVALLDKPCVTGKTASGNGAGVGEAVDGWVGGSALAVGGALHPCGYVEGEHGGLCAVVDGDVAVACVADDGVLAVQRRRDGAAVGHLGTPVHGEWRWSQGDALHLPEEVAGLRRLVVAAHLPHHGVAILVVVP